MFSWNFRDMWGSLGWLKDDLEQAEASAQAKWSRQHRQDGAHAHVTSDSVRSAMVSHSDPLWYTIPESVYTNSLGNPIVLNLPRRASVVMLGLEDPDTGVCHISQMKMPDAQIGDVVRIVLGLYTPVIYFHDSARPNATALVPANHRNEMGWRLSLHPDSTTAVTEGSPARQYRRTNASGRRTFTFLRIDRSDSLWQDGTDYPCWIEID